MKTVSDTFTMPDTEHSLIQKLRLRCMKLGIDINKSEIIRCGLRAIEQLNNSELKKITNELPKVRAGRPGKS